MQTNQHPNKFQNRPGNNGPSNGDEGFIKVLAVIFAVAGVLSGASIAAAELPSLISGHGPLHLPATDLAKSALVAWKHPATPAVAYPVELRTRIIGPIGYWAIATLTLALLGAVAVVLFRVFRTPPRALDRRQRFGKPVDARLAAPSDIHALRIRDVTEPDRIVLGRVGRRLVATQTDRAPRKQKAFQQWAGPSHVMVTAPTRSGKTYWLAQALALWNNPAVVLSVKADLLDATIANRTWRGDVRVCGFIDHLPHGARWATWDILAEAATWDGANRLAKRLASVAPSTAGAKGRDEGWIEQSANIVAVALLLARAAHKTMEDVVDWIFGLSPNPADGAVNTMRTLAATLIDDTPDTAAGRALRRDLQRGIDSLTTAAAGAPTTWTGVYMTARRLVTPWLHPTVRAFTTPTPDSITLPWLRSGANTLYVVASVADGKDTSPALGAFIARLIHAALEHDPGPGRRPPVLFALDEMANISFRDLPEWSSVTAGAGIRLITVWQSHAQIRANYGDHTNTILNNHVTKLVFGANSDRETLEAASFLTGTEHLPAHHSTFRDDPHALTNQPIAQPDLLRRLPKGRALLIHSNLPPMELRVLTNRQFRRLEHESLRAPTKHVDLLAASVTRAASRTIERPHHK